MRQAPCTYPSAWRRVRPGGGVDLSAPFSQEQDDLHAPGTMHLTFTPERSGPNGEVAMSYSFPFDPEQVGSSESVEMRLPGACHR